MNPFELTDSGNPCRWLLRAAEHDSNKRLNVSIFRCSDYQCKETENSEEAKADSAVLSELERRLGFEYSHSAAVELHSKVTATELKGFEEKPENEENDSVSILPKKRFFRRPDLGGAEKPATGAERGTATHKLLQYIRFAGDMSLDYVKSEIERLSRENFISPREAQSVDAESVVALFSSETGRKMLAAGDKLRREFRFSLLVDASELGMCKERGEKTLLQGVVDCCLEEDGEIVIIDYKTDGVFSDEDVDARANFYEGQVKTYALALERILKKPVKECVLYFLRPGREKTVKLP